MNRRSRKFALAALLTSLSAAGYAEDAPIQNIKARIKPYLDSAIAGGNAFVNLSSASEMPNIAPRSLTTAYGANLALRTEIASSPFPISLGGISIEVVDAAGTVRLAQLLYVSPTQVNYIVPAGTAKGLATVRIISGANEIPTSSTPIQGVAPALFTANGDGSGVVSAIAHRSVIPTDFEAPVQVYQCSGAPGSCVSVPIDVGLDAPVTVVFYATGLLGRSSDSAVKLTIAGQSVPIQNIVSEDESTPNAGIDMVAAALPVSLRGLGEVDVVLSVDGSLSNTARINIQ